MRNIKYLETLIGTFTQMKKYLLILLLPMLYFSLSTTAYASSNPESTFENYETTNYNFFEVNFDIPSNWRVVETDDRKTVYFYPEEGVFMFQYIDDISLETEESRKDFEVGLNQSGGKLDNEKILTNNASYNDAYLYELEYEVNSQDYSGNLMHFDTTEGVMIVSYMLPVNSSEDYSEEYSDLLASMGFEVDNDEQVGLIKTDSEDSKYENSFTVSFNDYEIYYLIDEDDSTISIFTSDAPSDVYVSQYTGDFNNGINFDWDGLKMRAHYNYWNQDSKLIIHDESGNELEAQNSALSVVEEFMNKHN